MRVGRTRDYMKYEVSGRTINLPTINICQFQFSSSVSKERDTCYAHPLDRPFLKILTFSTKHPLKLTDTIWNHLFDECKFQIPAEFCLFSFIALGLTHFLSTHQPIYLSTYPHIPLSWTNFPLGHTSPQDIAPIPQCTAISSETS